MSTSHGRQGSPAVLVADLYFAAIISSAAAKLDVPLVFVKPGDPIPADARLAIVDLQFPADWEAAVTRFVASGGEAVAFGPHVQGDLMKRGRRAGCRRVMAKSKFVEEVSNLLASVQSPAPIGHTSTSE